MDKKMAVKLIIGNKTYNWNVTEEKAKEILKKYGGRESISFKLSESEVKAQLSAIDPYTIGLLIGGGLGAGVAWIAYRFTKEQLSEFEKNYVE